jgi:hypothetical protein
MQEVVGSSPIIRFFRVKHPCKLGVLTRENVASLARSTFCFHLEAQARPVAGERPDGSERTPRLQHSLRGRTSGPCKRALTACGFAADARSTCAGQAGMTAKMVAELVSALATGERTWPTPA